MDARISGPKFGEEEDFRSKYLPTNYFPITKGEGDHFTVEKPGGGH